MDFTQKVGGFSILLYAKTTSNTLCFTITALDIRLIHSIFDFTGIPRLVEAVASHLDTEEVTVEGFQLLSRLAALPEAYRTINECKVLDLAYVALFAYSGTAHRHTRLAIKSTLHSFQKCALFDPRELARRERASRTDIALYVLLLFCFMLNTAFSLYGQPSSNLVFAVRRAVVDTPWNDGTSPDTAMVSLQDVHSIGDVWSFLQGPVQSALFQDMWYNGDSFADDVESQIGIVDRTNKLLGGVELRQLRVGPTTSCNFPFPEAQQSDPKWCYPHFSKSAELKTPVSRKPYFEDTWTDGSSHSNYEVYRGSLAAYPGSGYRRFLPRLGANLTSDTSNDCDSRCELAKLRRGRWLDESSRALFVRFNLYNAALDLHCVVQLLFEFGVATAGSAEGGGGEVITSAEVTPLHLSQYPGLFVIQPRFLTEIGILVGIVWFAHKQLNKLLQYRLFYFLIPSHVADFSIVVLWRFDSSRARAQAAAIDGVAMLELAKHQLEAHGMLVEETSFAKKLRAAAGRGIKKIKHVTREILAVSDEPEKLSDLKKAWGLEKDHLQLESVPEDETAIPHDNELTSDKSSRSGRWLNDMSARLGKFQSYLSEELGPDKPVEDSDEVVEIKQSEWTEVGGSTPKEEMRDADVPPDDSSELQTSAGLPGAILDANEDEAVVAQTMHTDT
ncbi:unnamed protein product [Phytophthora fragariaefolia]|uniref:Unnamed protein product n=1 Tax=Phytophthora fragariaefolia TaxID=1490495 RepID=A0A9W7CWS5_9STRA|nr:unnamed protein product [Phytophthora fragariaefolia]